MFRQENAFGNVVCKTSAILLNDIETEPICDAFQVLWYVKSPIDWQHSSYWGRGHREKVRVS